MDRLSQSFYALLLQLHPVEFRNRFGDEMLLDYQAGIRDTCGHAPHWDALLSLGRQWVHCIAARNEVETSAASFVRGQYVAVAAGGLTPIDLLKGLLLSLTLL